MNSKFVHSLLLKYFVILINILLGAFLWADYFTKYSIIGKYSEFLFPPIVGVIGFISYRFLTKKNPENQEKNLYKATTALSVIGGLLSLIMVIPPMCLVSYIFLSNNIQETKIQQEISPNNMQVATVYHGHVGIVDGSDRYSIRIHPRWFPVIEKEVYFKDFASPSWCINHQSNCIHWIDNNTIYISETRQEVKTDKIEFDTPIWLNAVAIVLGVIIVFMSPK